MKWCMSCSRCVSWLLSTTTHKSNARTHDPASMRRPPQRKGRMIYVEHAWASNNCTTHETGENGREGMKCNIPTHKRYGQATFGTVTAIMRPSRTSMVWFTDSTSMWSIGACRTDKVGCRIQSASNCKQSVFIDLCGINAHEV